MPVARRGFHFFLREKWMDEERIVGSGHPIRAPGLSIDNSGLSFDVTGTYNLAFLTAGALGIIGIILSWSVRPIYSV